MGRRKQSSVGPAAAMIASLLWCGSWVFPACSRDSLPTEQTPANRTPAEQSLTNPKAVEIHGSAENAKLSAAVVTDNEVVYCLDRTEWPPDVVGKRVVVEGILEESDEFTSRQAPTGEVSAGTSGPVLVIRNSQYRVVELPGR